MTVTTSDFYVLGGTLPRDARSYVVRKADSELLDGLRRGQFCYVLTSRQMGKSSLMVRTATRLRQERITCVVLDMTSVGQNVNEEQWYDGLLNRLAIQLDLEELDAFWASHQRLGPLQRWMEALRSVVLARVSGRIVLFVDEIDVVRSLPFSTDEFFAAIRECYNRRTEDSDYERLTFCLLGVATPADLIRESRSTPFNIGTRIELTDFTPAEAVTLAEGLGVGRWALGVEPPDAQRLLARVLYWTGGHPYLTQRLCQAVAEASTGTARREGDATHPSSPFFTPNNCKEQSVVPSSSALRQRLTPNAKRHPPNPPHAGSQGREAKPRPLAVRGVWPNAKRQTPNALVDRICEEMFLSSGARSRDDNLLFVRERLLRGTEDRADLLEIYGQVRAGKRVKDDETSPLLSVLRLAGIVKPAQAVLRVRNRIYARNFDREWIRANMPDAELRRQKMAYRRGFVRAITLSAFVVAVTGGLAATAIRQSQKAHRYLLVASDALNHEHDAMNHEHASAELTRRYLYAANMNLAQQAWNNKNYGRVRELLEECRPQQGEDDLRGFEWWLLWQRGHFDLPFLPQQSSYVTTRVAFSADGRTIRTDDGHGNVIYWDSQTGEILPQSANHALAAGFRQEQDPTRNGSLSPDGRYRAEGRHYYEEEPEYRHPSVTLHDARTGALLHTLKGAMAEFAFSPDSRRLATESNTDDVLLWDTATGARIGTLSGARGPVAFSPDGKRLAAGTYAYGWGIKLFDVTASREPQALSDTADAAAVSAQGNLLATLNRDWDSVTLRDATTLRALKTLPGATYPLAVSTDGRTVVTASRGQNGVLILWSALTGREASRLTVGTNFVEDIAFSPNGELLAVGVGQEGVKLWDMAARREVRSFPQGTGTPAFSRDGKLLAVPEFRAIAGHPEQAPIQGVVLYDVASGNLVRALEPAQAPIAFSPTGPLVATGMDAVQSVVWKIDTGLRSATLRGLRYAIHTCAFSPDGKRLAAGDAGEYNVTIWDTATGREVYQIPGRTNRDDVASYALFFSPDGTRLYSGNQDGTIKVWDAGTMR